VRTHFAVRVTPTFSLRGGRLNKHGKGASRSRRPPYLYNEMRANPAPRDWRLGFTPGCSGRNTARREKNEGLSLDTEHSLYVAQVSIYQEGASLPPKPERPVDSQK
jgi:hypothetical protein